MGDPIKTIQKAISEFFAPSVSDINFDVGLTTDSRHGDLTTNAAMAAFSNFGEKYKSPRDLAEEIVKHLNAREEIAEIFSKIEIAGPGFINFWYSTRHLERRLGYFSEKKNLHHDESSYTGKKVMVEFTDPNPFKEFHIGHLYSNIVGESISRILEANGAEVRRVCYQGDVGMHVAKALWGLFEKLKAKGALDEEFKKLSEKSLEARIKFLGEAYALGATEYEESEDAKREIIELNKKVFEKDVGVMPYYEVGREWSLEYFDRIYKRLGTKFWKLYFESEVGARGKEIVEDNLGKVFEKSEGAVIFPGEKYGLHNRVFVNSLGLPTYEAKELGLAPTKYEDYQYDTSIIVTGNEIVEYFRVLLKALWLIDKDLADKTRHIAHGMVRLPSGKMSSRTGRVVTGESMLDEAVSKAWDKVQEVKVTHTSKQKEMKMEVIESPFKSQNETAKTVESVGIGAVKYALLRQSIGHDVIFNFDEVVNFEGNSGPYLQYSYVRIKSILEKAGVDVGEGQADIPEKMNEEESDLLRYLMLYPITVQQAGENFAPSTIATYLYDLSQKFNTFYQKHKVIGGKNEKFRLSLCAAFGNALKDGLQLLGIETVEKM